MRWLVRGICLAAIVVVGWVAVTALPAVIHGHPLYAGMLVATLVVAILVGLRSVARSSRPTGWGLAGSIVGCALALGWIFAIAWLRPFKAVEPALAAMRSGNGVTVTESATDITMAPAAGNSGAALFFQPGARVDARAYAAVLRPMAEAGHLVVIAKQPLGVAFLATGAFGKARSAHPEVTSWVVGGHSLGGTVAANTAVSNWQAAPAPVTGLLLYASYPASNMRDTLGTSVLSISGSQDGLATPADIEASRAELPATADFQVITGAVHAFFGDYGPQPGDGVPTISHDQARAEISALSTKYLAGQRIEQPAQ